jgi:hypothetical protein
MGNFSDLWISGFFRKEGITAQKTCNVKLTFLLREGISWREGNLKG